MAPEASRIHYALALAYERLGDAPRAAAHLERRGSVAPPVADRLMDAYHGLLESALAYHNRGFEAFGTGRWAEAAEAFRAGLELEPENVALRHTLGTALHQMGDVRAAVAEFEALLEIDPSHTRALFSLGVIFASEGRYDEARRRLEAAIEHEPDYVQARLMLADLLQGMGRPEAALSQYEAVVDVDPPPRGGLDRRRQRPGSVSNATATRTPGSARPGKSIPTSPTWSPCTKPSTPSAPPAVASGSHRAPRATAGMREAVRS